MTESNKQCDQLLIIKDPEPGTSPLCPNLFFSRTYSQRGYEAARPSFNYFSSIPLMIAFCFLDDKPCQNMPF